VVVVPSSAQAAISSVITANKLTHLQRLIIASPPSKGSDRYRFEMR
jgi:hypothetical protein